MQFFVTSQLQAKTLVQVCTYLLTWTLNCTAVIHPCMPLLCKLSLFGSWMRCCKMQFQNSHALKFLPSLLSNNIHCQYNTYPSNIAIQNYDKRHHLVKPVETILTNDTFNSNTIIMKFEINLVKTSELFWRKSSFYYKLFHQSIEISCKCKAERCE